MKLKLLATVLVGVALTAGYQYLAVPDLQKKDPDAGLSRDELRSRDERAQENWAYSLGLQAYIWGLPLTITDRERLLRLNERKLRFVTERQICPCAPINQIGHMTKLATSDDELPYTPNNDTVYSGVMLELKDDPVILSLPEVHDRYWSVQVVDAYLENLPYIGTRATLGKGGHYLFTGPDWQGEVPPGVELRRLPTNSGALALRYGVSKEDPQDLPRVLELQKQVHTTSLSNWSRPDGFGKVVAVKMNRKEYSGDLAVFERMVDLLNENPPRPGQQAAVAMFQSIGIELGKPFDASKLHPATVAGLKRALQDSQDLMTWKVKYRGTPYPTRWNNLHEGTYGFHFINRAEGALEGLMVHDREEGVYFSTYEDGTGQLLDGQSRYVLHFERDALPQLQNKGFWSITLYGTNFQLVDNAIDRYSIGDRTPGLKYNPDGSLTLYIQHQPPAGQESNWLPTPQTGLFRLNYRIYLPNEQTRNPQTLQQFIPAIQPQDQS
ncbi:MULTISPECIES: DUF1254 domain-containing protein [Pseudomonas]|jgi:hypothetical protein|uniref:DUF1254 domain-containing protein n=1 Tax=Pseudomonas TaxID=286 RepID=UPI00103A7795|nr:MULTISPECIES: DUF1254 domain-containing protein [Pseudomonas]MBG7279478.1 DUF1254 domain-containing protein [Pseudomonas aeruginosa]MDH1443862.1 DUF1214 domain-containing protein [Pseudomonas sp. GD03722]MDI3827801.1 DUF1214 domain-containing protein [Pseudomonas aeruginosa]MDU0575358.1 DUF1214 domain-containing protein [Pseudomonas aeruginosa]MDU0653988.1 DUF1214 domain-containing protein [Pseudomonas aeruginosa]